jgi:hypothetical protein
MYVATLCVRAYSHTAIRITLFVDTISNQCIVSTRFISSSSIGDCFLEEQVGQKNESLAELPVESKNNPK